MLYFYLFFIFIFGLIIGSFLNCLIWRLHKKESMWNRSYCPKCLKQIAWYDNIPIFSFLWLRGRGRCCGQRISWQYPAVELATGVLFVIAFLANFEFQILNFDLILIIQLLRDWFIISE